MSSFVRLNSNEFPPLGQASSSSNSSGSGHHHIKSLVAISDNDNNKPSLVLSKRELSKGRENGNGNDNDNGKDQNSQQNEAQEVEDEIISGFNNTKNHSNIRIGIKQSDYTEELEKLFKEHKVGHHVDYIMLPIEPVRPSIYDQTTHPIPDLALPNELWQYQIALDLGYQNLDNYHIRTAAHFDFLIRHALYLDCDTIVITCPNSDSAIVSIASIINDRLNECITAPKILFRVPISDRNHNQKASSSWICNVSTFTASKSSLDEPSERDQSIDSSGGGGSGKQAPTSWTDESPPAYDTTASFNSSFSYANSAWSRWNALRSHLNADPRLGVCLSINDDLPDAQEELNRWSGEPVKMIELHTDQFITPSKPYSQIEINLKCKQFLEKVIVANSFKTSILIDYGPSVNVLDYVSATRLMMHQLSEKHGDFSRGWNDKIQPPLQPLSTDLASSTYNVFETDVVKYKRYQTAMAKAIKNIISKRDKDQLTLMVLGAGRGPLVDSFIASIKSLKLNGKKSFIIYALDKNPSSVRSLLYKQQKFWKFASDNIETHVVHSDMRAWNPNIKADIIATELLGSLSDNELSPECIDGTWSISTPETISIPQRYSSYVVPICSQKIFQELYKLKKQERHTLVYDQIYVVKLSNYYMIDKPQELFKFEHLDLSKPPEERCNQRYTRLTFWSKVDTVCHGFAGYFLAELFNNVTISTVKGQETPKMHSWFPAFIPLDTPIQLPRGTRLEAHFWRKESASSVWYQWVITHPLRTRMYSQNGFSTAMSKSI